MLYVVSGCRGHVEASLHLAANGIGFGIVRIDLDEAVSLVECLSEVTVVEIGIDESHEGMTMCGLDGEHALVVLTGKGITLKVVVDIAPIIECREVIRHDREGCIVGVECLAPLVEVDVQSSLTQIESHCLGVLLDKSLNHRKRITQLLLRLGIDACGEHELRDEYQYKYAHEDLCFFDEIDNPCADFLSAIFCSTLNLYLRSADILVE